MVERVATKKGRPHDDPARSHVASMDSDHQHLVGLQQQRQHRYHPLLLLPLSNTATTASYLTGITTDRKLLIPQTDVCSHFQVQAQYMILTLQVCIETACLNKQGNLSHSVGTTCAQSVDHRLESCILSDFR